ncbi:MAG: hypothetical protein JSS64_00465 [Bacteroidetes bacterium]|nr:hypothetical protein [Bacteroidota bacterium]
MKYLIFLSLFISLGACSHVPTQSEIFADYLQKNFQKEIPLNHHTYVSFPKNSGCLGCSEHTLSFLLSNNFDNVTIICSETQKEQIASITNNEVLVDLLSELEHLNLNTQNVAIIETEHSKIKQIISIQANNLDSILKAYFVMPVN